MVCDHCSHLRSWLQGIFDVNNYLSEIPLMTQQGSQLPVFRLFVLTVRVNQTFSPTEYVAQCL